jgi:hypothetical protein
VSHPAPTTRGSFCPSFCRRRGSCGLGGDDKSVCSRTEAGQCHGSSYPGMRSVLWRSARLRRGLSPITRGCRFSAPSDNSVPAPVPARKGNDAKTAAQILCVAPATQLHNILWRHGVLARTSGESGIETARVPPALLVQGSRNKGSAGSTHQFSPKPSGFVACEERGWSV